MKTTKFKTNIKCSAWVEKVTPHLNQSIGQGNWEVDLQDPTRTLTIKLEASEAEINLALNKAGYKAEAMGSW